MSASQPAAPCIQNQNLPILFRCEDNPLVGGRNLDVNRVDAGVFCQGFAGGVCFQACANWR